MGLSWWAKYRQRFFARHHLLFTSGRLVGMLPYPLCRRFVIVVLSNFSMAIVLSCIACVFINWRFSSAMMTLTGVVGSSPVMARPA